MSFLKVIDNGEEGREIHHRLMDDAVVTAQKWLQKADSLWPGCKTRVDTNTVGTCNMYDRLFIQLFTE